MILVLALLAVILVVWWLSRMHWPFKAHKTPVADPRPEVPGAHDMKTAWFGRLRLPFRKERNLAAWFSRWVVEANLTKRIAVYKRLPEDAAEFSAWVSSLSSKELTHFVNDLSGLCHALGFDLAWLADAKLPADLKRGLEEAVILCSLTAWKAREVEPLAAFVAWQKAPHKAENRAFAGALYARLVNAGLTTTPATLVLAPDKERQKAVTRAIESAAVEHHGAFTTLVRQVMAELKAGGGTAEAAPAPTPTDEAAAPGTTEAA
jgi:hypothetical protein